MEMKLRHFLWVGVPLLAGVMSYAVATGHLRQAWSQLVKTRPVIEYPVRIDLGEHEIGDQAVARFRIANRGGGELVIDEIRTNCSCTGMERERDGEFGRVESLRLQAGEETELAMRISVRGVPVGAEMINVVQFRTNDPDHPEGRIEAVVRRVSGGVAAVPNPIVFGTVPAGTQVVHVIEVWDSALTPRVIDRVTSTNPDRVTAKLVPVTDQPGDASAQSVGTLIGRIEVAVDTHSPGAVDESVQIYLKDESRKPDAISVIGRVAAPVEVSPALLVLPRASADRVLFEGTCVCRSRDGTALSLTVDRVPPELTVELLDDGQATRRIRITWHPEADKKQVESQRHIIRVRAKAGKEGSILEVQVLLKAGRE